MENNNVYLSFEGVIGVGKTTLASMLSERYDAYLLKEIVEENPFLHKFYEDPEHWAFQTESFFLCNRYMQLKKVRQLRSEEHSVVSDYHILKNLIFAQLTLEKEEFKKYKKLFKIMIEDFDAPRILIYSEGSIEEITRRIKMRGREMEKDISIEYLSKLVAAYQKVMDPENIQKYYPGTQLIKINADKFDFIKDPSRLNELYTAVDNAIHNQQLLYQELA